MDSFWWWYYVIWGWASVLAIPLWIATLVLVIRSRRLLLAPAPAGSDAVVSSAPASEADTKLLWMAVATIAVPFLSAALGLCVLVGPSWILGLDSAANPGDLLFPGAGLEIVLIMAAWAVASLVLGWIVGLFPTYLMVNRRARALAAIQGSLTGRRNRSVFRVARVAAVLGLILCPVALPLFFWYFWGPGM